MLGALGGGAVGQNGINSAKTYQRKKDKKNT